MTDVQKILIVDDRTENLKALEKILAASGATTIRALSGNEALTATLGHDFSLAILDVQMPGMDGYELASLLRSDAKTKNLPVIFLSAVFTDEEHVFKGYASGAVDFLTKPFNPEVLLSKVGIFLQLDRQRREIEDKLEIEIARNHLETVIESIWEAIIVLSRRGAILRANRAALNLLGYKSEELVGLSADLLFHRGRTVPVTGLPCAEERKSWEFFSIETNLTKKSGEPVPVLLSRSLLFDRDGVVYGEVLSAVNISERLAAEQSLRDSEERYRMLFNKGNDLILVHQPSAQMDTPWPLLDANEIACNALGYSREELLALNLVDIVAPEDRDMPPAIVEKLRRDGDVLFNREFVRKDGSRLPVEINAHLFEYQGLSTVISVARDISERLAAEGAQRELRNFLDGILNQLPDPVSVKDSNLCWTLVNNKFCEIVGLARERLLGKSDAEIFPPAEAKVFLEMDKEVLASRREVFSEEQLTNVSTGKIVHLQTKKTLYTDTKDNRFIVAVGRDVTEQKKLEIQLRHAQKMEAIGTLAGGIAHDFNNILTAILGYAEMAMDDLPDKARQDIEQVIKAGKRASDLVRQILTFSRQTEQQRQPLFIHHIAKEAIKLLRPSIPSTIEIRQKINEQCGPTLADPSQIHQVIMNLCTNAFQAMRDTGGVLSLGLSQSTLGKEDIRQMKRPIQKMMPGEYLMLEVSDTGCGMDLRTMEKIFEPYFTTKKDSGGTGLGLATVHGIVANCGGSVSVYSEPGQGTTFKVYLPVIPEDVSTTGSREPEKTDETLPTGTERVLVVDDETPIVELGKRTLGSLGYQVTGRVGSRKALAEFMARPEEFDLLLTDLTMPDMSGLELARQILARRPDLPVILCTGFSETLSREKAAAFGVREYVMKPILKADLARVVRRVLDQSAPSGKKAGEEPTGNRTTDIPES